MNYKIITLVLMIFPVYWNSTATAADSDDEPLKLHGVILDIAKDRKIEKKGGIYEAEGLDKYVDRRLTEVDKHLSKIEEKIVETNLKLSQLTIQIAQLSESVAFLDKGTPAASDSSQPKKTSSSR